MARGIVGAQLYTVRAFLRTLDEVGRTFERIAEIGYTVVEGFHSHEDPMAQMNPREIARLARDNGLTIISVHWRWARFLNDLDKVIEEQLAFGSKLPVICGVAISATEDPLEGLKRFQQELGQVVDKLDQVGMHLTYHNPFQQFVKIGRKYWFDLLYEQTDARTLSFEPDTFWLSHAGADPILWLRKLAGRVTLLHCKDVTLTREHHPSRHMERRWAEVGEGNLNWPGILEVAEEIGVEYYFVEQDDTYGRDPRESLAISYRNLKAMGLS